MMEKGTSEVDKELVEKLFSVGAHYGYSRTRRHPSVAPFVFGIKNKVEIFDLEKVQGLLTAAKEYVHRLGQEKKRLLFVGGKHEAREAVREAAQELHMPYVAGRWIGGTLTNFPQIKKRLLRLEELRAQRERGDLEKKYTKREQLAFDREIADLERYFEGLLSMEGLPSALFVVDTRREQLAVREAKRMGIPVVGILNSDGNTADASYPIVGNSNSMQSIRFFVSAIKEAYQDGLRNPLETGEEEKKEEHDS